MALVDDDVREVVLRVVRQQEVGIGLVGINAERLVRCHDDPGVALGVARIGGSHVVAELVLQRAHGLPDQ